MSVRNARSSDAEDINRVFNHFVEHSAATFETEQWSLERRDRWMEQFLNPSNGYLLLVAEAEGAVVGYACNQELRPKPAYRTSTETTVYVDPGCGVRGNGTALYQALFDRIDRKIFHRAYAGIVIPNPASLALHRRFGFQLVGTFNEVGYKFKRYHSVAWYEKEL